MKKISNTSEASNALTQKGVVRSFGVICRRQDGLTLVELLVAVAILTIVIGTGYARFVDVGRNTAIEGNAQLLAAGIRQAQLFAYTGRLNGAERPTSYGINIVNTKEYLIFADVTGGTDYIYNSGADTVIERFTLPQAIVIDQVGTDIAFRTPGGPVYIDGAADGANKVITVSSAGTSLTYTVTVRGVSGQVEIN